MALVKFISCTAAAYAGAAKDEGTLYFLSDTRQIMKGSVPFGGGIYKAVESYPETGEVNTIYVNTADGSAKFWNGNGYTVLVKPSATVLSGSGDNLHLPTTKAVIDYVTQKVADLDVSAIVDRVTALEGKVDVEKVSTAISAGVTEAKGYTDTEVAKKANKVHTHVLADITDAGALAGKDKVAEADLETALAAKIDGKADKATTLAGYGISDAYTKAQADSAIAAAVADAGHLKREIVDSLPVVASADEHTIYMVAKAGGTGDQKYDEFMFINGAFEKVGDTEVDLTNYATKTEVSTAKSEAISTAAADATSKADAAKTAAITAAATDATTKANKAKEDAIAAAATDATDKADQAKADAIAAAAKDATTKADKALTDAKTYADGLGKNYATAAQGAKADTALQAADIAEGATNGSIAVKGTDVKVHGLGSAAYTAATAYDTAGTGKAEADKALTSAKAYTDTALTWGTLQSPKIVS